MALEIILEYSFHGKIARFRPPYMKILSSSSTFVPNCKLFFCVHSKQCDSFRLSKVWNWNTYRNYTIFYTVFCKISVRKIIQIWTYASLKIYSLSNCLSSMCMISSDWFFLLVLSNTLHSFNFTEYSRFQLVLMYNGRDNCCLKYLSMSSSDNTRNNLYIAFSRTCPLALIPVHSLSPFILFFYPIYLITQSSQVLRES